ncbi:hypothetical protein LSH36_3g05071 [Paralvinella palmiformis]|uniref:2-oxo-4-hydroxy-4-carboxy-5-ureidoimidazoline decarboxylase n=1 Tax=Paralvinella palmiformis TaxID=53620 RepID=A0AAD9NJ74_9ANNE|nr:hypothetical protein LSH36_3g05071 [Paralvinella palmiformis]
MAKLYYLDEVNNLGYGEFTDIFGNIVEHCPVIAAAVWSRRPFSDFRSMGKAFCDVLDDLPGCVKEGVLRCHPDLAGRLAQMDTLTSESKNEQKTAGLLDLSVEEQLLLSKNNASYMSKFQFPFVICARENKKDTILTNIVIRQENCKDVELNIGIEEVKKIARLRLMNIIEMHQSNI